MWPAVAIAGIAALAVVARLLRTRGLDPAVSWTAGHQVLFLVATLPLIVLWIVSPSTANALSAPAVRRERQLSASERWTALRYALLHWRYFDRFVSADTQWLAPDNFQDDPTPVIAPRTSPTNVGLQLLSIVSAYDFGFLPCGTMVDRLEQVFRSLERMERWRGHFYNWYELAELRVLEPAYISTVDSGNLAGHLIALKQACLGIADEPVIDGRLWEALHTALTIAAEELRNAASSGAVDSPRQWQAVLEAAERVRAVLASLPQVAGWPSGAGPGAGPAPLAVPTVASSAASAAGAAAPGTRAFAAGPQGYASPQVIQTLLDRLRTAERVLIERGGAPAPAPPPRVVTGGVAPLVPAGESVPSDVLANEPPTAWLRWSRALLEGHLAEVTATGLRDAAPAATDGRPGDARLPRVPTWREAAHTSIYAAQQLQRLEALATRAESYANEMDFTFLYDARRKLFSIGYQVASSSLDPSYYDLLASEARLASFVAIAKDDVPVEHWFRLGRWLTTATGDLALISWSGSMFEYMMPALVMQSFPFTLLDQTYDAAVAQQIAYGRERGVPWGVSESAYNARDRNQIYQYRAFGVPALALKRGLSRDLVIAPYATLLAISVDPHRSMRNLTALEGEGALGAFGFRDAVDFTRPAPGTRKAVVYAYMAHHMGMGVVALDNAINRGIWPRRFHRDALVRSAELVLFERIPRRFTTQEAQTGLGDERPRRGLTTVEKPAARSLDTAETPRPHIALLGRAPYTMMITNGGGGFSRFEGLDVTRWRADGTLDNSGQWCYIKDVTPPLPPTP